MKVVYIAGPYRASTPWGVEQNIRRAEDVAVRVHKAGMMALCPHANARHMEGDGISDEHMLTGTMELMRRCDAVLLVGEEWKNSAGSRAEVTVAMMIGLPVLYAWGDESYCEGILTALKRKPDGYRVAADSGMQDPFAPESRYWGAYE